jgi:hypothetical protein
LPLLLLQQHRQQTANQVAAAAELALRCLD